MDSWAIGRRASCDAMQPPPIAMPLGAQHAHFPYPRTAARSAVAVVDQATRRTSPNRQDGYAASAYWAIRHRPPILPDELLPRTFAICRPRWQSLSGPHRRNCAMPSRAPRRGLHHRAWCLALSRSRLGPRKSRASAISFTDHQSPAPRLMWQRVVCVAVLDY